MELMKGNNSLGSNLSSHSDFKYLIALLWSFLTSVIVPKMSEQIGQITVKNQKNLKAKKEYITAITWMVIKSFTLIIIPILASFWMAHEFFPFYFYHI